MTEEEQPVEEQIVQYSSLCTECATGIMRLEYLTYFTWLNDELVTVPNFPAWVCDVCGRREYDARAVNWLNTLLHPETGRKTPRRLKRTPRIRRVERPRPHRRDE